MRFILYPLLLALIGYGLWPFYTVFQLDQAINATGTAELEPLVDLASLRAETRARVTAGVETLLPPTPPAAPGSTAAAIGQTLGRIGAAALEAGVEQTITLAWARETLREAATRATNQKPPYLVGAIDYAFFERHDRLLIRLGRLGYDETHVRLTRQGTVWRVTDIIR